MFPGIKINKFNTPLDRHLRHTVIEHLLFHGGIGRGFKHYQPDILLLRKVDNLVQVFDIFRRAHPALGNRRNILPYHIIRNFGQANISFIRIRGFLISADKIFLLQILPSVMILHDIEDIEAPLSFWNGGKNHIQLVFRHGDGIDSRMVGGFIHVIFLLDSHMRLHHQKLRPLGLQRFNHIMVRNPKGLLLRGEHIGFQPGFLIKHRRVHGTIHVARPKKHHVKAVRLLVVEADNFRRHIPSPLNLFVHQKIARS